MIFSHDCLLVKNNPVQVHPTTYFSDGSLAKKDHIQQQYQIWLIHRFISHFWQLNDNFSQLDHHIPELCYGEGEVWKQSFRQHLDSHFWCVCRKFTTSKKKLKYRHFQVAFILWHHSFVAGLVAHRTDCQFFHFRWVFFQIVRKISPVPQNIWICLLRRLHLELFRQGDCTVSSQILAGCSILPDKTTRHKICHPIC